MAQDLTGLQGELSVMKQELLTAVAELREDVARIDATTRETDRKVQHLGEEVARIDATTRETDRKVQHLGEEVARIDATTRETDRKVQYLCDHLLGDADQRALRRAAGKH